jgi:hypothetical protein
MINLRTTGAMLLALESPVPGLPRLAHRAPPLLTLRAHPQRHPGLPDTPSVELIEITVYFTDGGRCGRDAAVRGCSPRAVPSTANLAHAVLDGSSRADAGRTGARRREDR